jgi:hypothetical protein
MALGFNQSKGGAVKDRADSYDYKDGENTVRLVGDLLARYVYWIEGDNKKNLPFECLAFDRKTEKFNNQEVDHVKEFYPDLKCSWAYAIQCIDVKSGQLKILNLKKKLMQQMLDVADQLGLDPTDPQEGFDIVFTKKKTGPLPINVEYTVMQLKCKARPLNEEEMAIAEKLKSMDEVLPRPTPEAQKALLTKLASGGEAGESVDEEINEEFEVK